MLRELRVPPRPLSLLTPAALAVALLVPVAAPAGESRRVPPGAHRQVPRGARHTSIARGPCALKRGKRSTSRASTATDRAARSSSRASKPTGGTSTSTGHASRAAGRASHACTRAAAGKPPRPSAATAPAAAGAADGTESTALVPPIGTPPAPEGSVGPPGTPPAEGVENDPIDPRYLTEVPFGTSSFWVQPWRAYLDTWPASRLLDSLGINFNVGAADAEGTARLLQDSGFTLARIEINWDSLAYGSPAEFIDEPKIRARLLALRNHGLRPLILLDANSEGPAPARRIILETTSEAPAGAQSVVLAPASAAEAVPGKTGFDRLSFGGDPDILITSVDAGGVATLSRPLPQALAAGAHKGTTLLYAPFSAPTLADGEPNPAFRETLTGWLGYVAAVCREAASVFGPEGYDLEVWNELSFGSQFLNPEAYYGPSAEAEPGAAMKEITKALLAETVAYVRNPANGISQGVGITSGFADQSPFPSGAQAPPGLTALSKHLYDGAKSFPSDYPTRSIIPVDASGARDTASKESFTPLFIPSYQSLFPEYYLTATSTETVIRDLAPFTTHIYGDPHGREVGPPGGGPVQKWMTEYNLSTNGATPVGPDETTPAQTTLTPADRAHFQAKALLRSLVAMVSKGMTREYFYAAAGHALALVDPGFYATLEAHPEAYPGDALGGETMSGFRNTLARFQGPGPGGPARGLTLLSIAQDGDHAQFSGDGTAAHPALYDREVLAVFPFQSSPTRFVIPVYVMTRDLLTLYEPEAPAGDIHRFDLPDETFRITLGNLPETGTLPTVGAYDPLRNQSTPARLVSRNGGAATVEIAATDYPRILTIGYG
jgi:hypothetical protein